MDTTPKAKKNLQYYMRAIHRILGYLTVGMVVVYAFSGIILIHRMGNFMKSSTEMRETLSPNLTPDQLSAELKIKKLHGIEDTEQTIAFSDGTYEKNSGKVTYIKKELIAPFDKMVDLHKLPDAKDHHIAACTTAFGIALLLLAITSLFMYKPASKQFKANMIYTAIGIALTVILLILV